MGKDDKKDSTAERRDNDSAETDKDSGNEIDSSNELEAVRSKKGEPPDNLRRRAEWFQKRTGGGS